MKKKIDRMKKTNIRNRQLKKKRKEKIQNVLLGDEQNLRVV